MNNKIKSIVPEIPVVMPSQSNLSIISDNDLLKIYNEILDDLRNDRDHVDELLTSFVEMVINEGDGSSASKEALVNLAKLKSEIATSKCKVADLMTSLKLKDNKINKINANQTNNITITDRRNLIETINKLKDKEKTNELDKSE